MRLSSEIFWVRFDQLLRGVVVLEEVELDLPLERVGPVSDRIVSCRQASAVRQSSGDRYWLREPWKADATQTVRQDLTDDVAQLRRSRPQRKPGSDSL